MPGSMRTCNPGSIQSTWQMVSSLLCTLPIHAMYGPEEPWEGRDEHDDQGSLLEALL